MGNSFSHIFRDEYFEGQYDPFKAFRDFLIKIITTGINIFHLRLKMQQKKLVSNPTLLSAKLPTKPLISGSKTV